MEISIHDAGEAPEDVWDDTTATRKDGATAGGAVARAEGTRRYKRGALLGAGAMGSVHQCEDQALEREVAVKAILPSLAASESIRARFVREARVQGKLEHPGIVPVHDFGFDADGIPFFAMKRVQGRSLRLVLRSRDPGEAKTPRRLLSAFSTVCMTVAFAHSRGVIHRDIKPSNIMLGDFGEVYLLDWGIAKDGSDEARGASKPPEGAPPRALPHGVTSAGDVLGTLGYMPPEQIRGGVVDTKADVYALGAVLYEILTRQPLHHGSEAEIVEATVCGREARPSRRLPHEPIPPELDELCARATALEPAERPSAREMHEVIERVLDGVRQDEASRALSVEHLARARAAMTHLPSEPRATRERATEELHRALVLDPRNAEALDLLRRLASERPEEDEISAAEQVDASASRAHRLMAGAMAALFVPWIGSIVLVLGTHARDGLVLGLLLSSIVVTTALAVWRAYSTAIGLVYGALISGLLACALMGFLFSPFILVPTMLSMVGVIFGSTASSSGKLRVRRFAQAGAVLAFGIPLLLEAAGVLPPSYEFREGGLFLFARAAEFLPAAETTRYLICFNISLIVIPGLVVERMRRHEISVERKAFLIAARRSRLLPRAARVADLAEGEE
ncbi:MAG TPA: serine/threonine-protein kinase, partial [Polyangiaceae bacterium]